jgi:long-chain acyl-CoA synthetase
MGTLVHEMLALTAARTSERVALIEPGRGATYGELDRLANRFANLLIEHGVQRGDRVVLALENSIELVACYFGTMKAGAVAVPLAPGRQNDRLARAIADCAPSACVVDGATANEPWFDRATAAMRLRLAHGAARGARAGEARAQAAMLVSALQASPDERPTRRSISIDLAAIIYTSGSTAAPRGVMLTHLNIVSNTRSIVSYLALTADDRVMCVLPFYYVYGLSLLHTHVAVGGSLVVDNRFVFPNVVLAAMQQHEVTGFAGVPSTFALLLHKSNLTGMSFPRLRYVTQAGGAMPPARIAEWLEKGPPVPLYVMYGATEASARLAYLEPHRLREKLGSIGKPIPNVDIQVLDDDGRPARPGETGELVARGSNIALGYWNAPEETSRKFGPMGYRTGDLGYRDEEGFLYLAGRRDDMIKVGAHRVGAKEIEDVLYEFPGVHEASVLGAPHDILGEVPVAFVAMREDTRPSDAELSAFCHERLAPHKVPARFILQAELPKMGMGKIDRGALRAAIAADAAQPAQRPKPA